MLMRIRKLNVLWFKSFYQQWDLPVSGMNWNSRKDLFFMSAVKSFSVIGKLNKYRINVDVRFCENSSSKKNKSSMRLEIVFLLNTNSNRKIELWKMMSKVCKNLHQWATKIEHVDHRINFVTYFWRVQYNLLYFSPSQTYKC